VSGSGGRPLEERSTHEATEVESSARNPREKVMGAALRILAARSYSEGELRDKLTAKGWAQTGVIDDCIERLKDLNYLNDDKFAHNYARYRVNLKPLGRARLARELAARKVSQSRIDKALDQVFEEVAEETLIDRAIERRTRTHGRPADRAASKRMFDHLGRLGFEYELISRKLRAIEPEIDESE